MTDSPSADPVEVPGAMVSLLAKRMDAYWRMERACVFLFPPIAFAAARPETLSSVAVLALSLLACCTTLWIGAHYWRAVWDALRRDRARMEQALWLADRWQAPCRMLAVASSIVAVSGITVSGFSIASATALGLSVLTALEYVNYYHVQLQNFDHLPTLRRFVRDRRFSKAHLAKALAAYRARRPVASIRPPLLVRGLSVPVARERSGGENRASGSRRT